MSYCDCELPRCVCWDGTAEPQRFPSWEADLPKEPRQGYLPGMQEFLMNQILRGYASLIGEQLNRNTPLLSYIS